MQNLSCGTSIVENGQSPLIVVAGPLALAFRLRMIDGPRDSLGQRFESSFSRIPLAQISLAGVKPAKCGGD